MRPYGSVSTYRPGPVPRRVLDRDRRGHVTVAIQRDPGGAFEAAWTRGLDGTPVGILPGGADHPLWGASDRIVTRPERPEMLTVCAALDWDRIDRIPALADPTRLPPGAGTAILNLLAGLAADQGVPALRYRGPYATEQLFWALLESFRLDDTPARLARFLGEAEETFLAGEPREVPVDWRPAPHERLSLDEGVVVQLREGVERVWWEGRTYYPLEWQGLVRDDHRVVRAEGSGKEVRYVAGLVALGHPLEDHLILDAAGNVLARPAPVDPGPETEAPLGPPWTETLGLLLASRATPLLSPAIQAVWPAFEVTWGPVLRDLVAEQGERLRLSWALPRRYHAEAGRSDAWTREMLAGNLVRLVVALLGPPVRRAAAAWLAAQPAGRQAELLESAREPAGIPLGRVLARLLEAIVAGEAVPVPP